MTFYSTFTDKHPSNRQFFGKGHGLRSMSSLFGDDDSFFPPGKGGPSGRAARNQPEPQQSPRSATPPVPSDITRPLGVSLEDLYAGATKHLKVGRRLLNGETEEKVLEIEVYPGWKVGTKIRFPRSGNEQRGGEAQDLVFIIEEKPHSVYVREGDNLTCHMKIPLVDALAGTGGKMTLGALDGRKLQIPVPSGVVRPGQESKVVGEGMPMRKDGMVRAKGDLKIIWDVVFPDRLTSAQKEGIRKVLG